MADLTRLFDAFDQLIGAAAGTLDEAAVRPHAEVARNVRRRSGFLGETVVVALAGGTGSGKSSLLNALAGEEVATVGAIRPTTSKPLAWIPETPEPGLTRLLDDMGVEQRVGHRADTALAIIDMPDVDSVVGAHRDIFEALLPRVDVVWWIVDPEKYNDRLLHKEYLEPLAEYHEQFLFVLNQIDRLDSSALTAVVDDLRRRLQADGIVDPSIVVVAARPPGRDPLGLDELWDAVHRRRDAKTSALRKLVVDVRRSAAAVAHLAGL
ncbi:MAG: 50S ribosome-binding GTPase, partial [Acidimicrobiia bacterium]|nr:50S ribosome-binding GTPase [Acidimicrobiia bacterium]